jgi:hypothetical protein
MTMQYQEIYSQRPKPMRTASNIIYILLMFPLDVLFFCILVTLLSLSVGTFIIWIGVPLLLLSFVAIRGMAHLEREMAVGLLRVPIPYAPARSAERRTWSALFKNLATDAYTWKSALYLLIKFPLSIISFCITVTLIALSFTITLAPVVYLVLTQVFGALHIHAQSDPPAWLQPYVFEVTGPFVWGDFLKSCVYCIVGILLCFLSRWIINGIAWTFAQITRVMLSSSEDERYHYQRAETL